MSDEGLLQYPVVIIHGFADRPTLSGIENVAETVLSELGIEHFTPEVQAFGSVFERSKSLVPQIAAKYPGRTVHLIAHSMVSLTCDLLNNALKKPLSSPRIGRIECKRYRDLFHDNGPGIYDQDCDYIGK